MMSHHGVIISVKPNERQTADLLLEQKFFEFHTARFTIFQSKDLSGLTSLSECPHPTIGSDKYNFSFTPESSKMCAEANLFHRGVDVLHGIFYDTGSTRPSEEAGQDAEDRDIWSHAETVRFVKNLWRDFTLDGDAVVITNVGGAGTLYMHASQRSIVNHR